MQKGDLLVGKVTDLTEDGKGVTRLDSGLVAFVEHTVPGDTVEFSVFRKKKNYLEGKLTRVLEKSPDRTNAFCIHFGTCGGCKFQTIRYEAQLSHKQQKVSETLHRLAKVPLPDLDPIIESPQQKLYRNKLEFTFSDRGWITQEKMRSGENAWTPALGFHLPQRFDKILDIRECHLQGGVSNEIREFVRKYTLEHHISYYNPVKQAGMMRNLMIRNTLSGEMMVAIIFGEPLAETEYNLLDALHGEFPSLTSLLYVVNTKKNASFYDLEFTVYSGLDHITEQMEGLRFKVGPKSFYQPNPLQAERLYAIALQFASLSGKEVVYDLYTGTGTIANYVARYSSLVIGIEYTEEAILFARENSEQNGITNTRFFTGDMRTVLTQSFVQENGSPDVIITDPPRAGMHEEVIATLLSVSPSRIVYISCNPATQARDIEMLGTKYEVKKIQPIDMFPQTPHVENIVLLELKTL